MKNKSSMVMLGLLLCWQPAYAYNYVAATQAEVNAGLNRWKGVTPKTLAGWANGAGGFTTNAAAANAFLSTNNFSTTGNFTNGGNLQTATLNTTGNATFGGVLAGSAGSAGAPSLYLGANPALGFYKPGSTSYALSDGVSVGAISLVGSGVNSGLRLASTNGLIWTSGASTATVDTSLSRASAGTVTVSNNLVAIGTVKASGWTMPTNSLNTGVWSVGGGFYFTNSATSFTLGAFGNIPTDAGWSIPFAIKGGGGGTNIVVTFPAGVVINGTNLAPATLTVCPGCVTIGNVSGQGLSFSNLSAPYVPNQ